MVHVVSLHVVIYYVSKVSIGTEPGKYEPVESRFHKDVLSMLYVQRARFVHAWSHSLAHNVVHTTKGNIDVNEFMSDKPTAAFRENDCIG